MAIQVRANFVLTEEEFESLSFDKQGDIIEKMLSHQDWDVEILSIEMSEVNMDSDNNLEDED